MSCMPTSDLKIYLPIDRDLSGVLLALRSIDLFSHVHRQVEDLISYLREMKEKELEEGESRLRRRGMAPPASSKGKKKAAKKKR